MWAVTVGTNVGGVWQAAFGDRVRFVLLGGAEVSQATFGNWFLVHSVVLPVLVIGGALLGWRHTKLAATRKAARGQLMRSTPL